MPTYERNPKHKSWLQPFDPDATQCPSWSHDRAQKMLDESMTDDTDDRRFATDGNMAFAARITRDDIWHGYPVPRAEVPETVRQRLIQERRITNRQIKRLFSCESLADELDR